MFGPQGVEGSSLLFPAPTALVAGWVNPSDSELQSPQAQTHLPRVLSGILHPGFFL